MGSDLPGSNLSAILTTTVRWLLLMALSASLAGCHLPGLPMALGAQPTSVRADAAVPVGIPPLQGTVSFGARKTQAAMTDVAYGATVSLIDTATNVTVATSLTDATGHFVLTFSGGFTPSSTTTYYLEAFKGLSTNRPGNNPARVRTIALYDHGWTTITNSTPNAGIVLDTATTALSIGAALVNGNPSPFAFNALIGALTTGSPDVYAPVAGLSAADYNAILALVETALAGDEDPVASVKYDPSTRAWSPVSAAITFGAITPTRGNIGASVTITGTGFNPVAASNLVKFNGVTAAVTAASATSLTTSVPAGAVSGQTTIQIGNVLYMGPTFQVNTVLSSVSPNTGSVGTSVTITGSGFDATAMARNAVMFNGVAATVTDATATSLTATVPSGAITGPITVTVAGSSGTSAGNFGVPVVLAGFVPLGGPAGTAVTIAGTGFASTVASNSVTFNGTPATITSASPTSLTVTAPSGTTGPIVVAVAGQTGTRPYAYTYGTPGPSAGATVQAFAGALIPRTGAQATNWAFTPRGSAVLDPGGNVIVAGEHTVYKITPTGAISALAGNGKPGFSGDNGPATSAQLQYPSDVALDAAGNLYIADAYNHRVRKVEAATGVMTTVAGTGTSGYGGDGLAATSAQLNFPNGVAIDGSGNLYIADTGNDCVRMVTAATGIITTVVGTGVGGYNGDDLAATSAQIQSPRSVVLDAAGNLYVLDSYNCRVRKVSASTGVITTVAGNGGRGFGGDGILATSSAFYYPSGLAIDPAGNLYISDSNNQRIRKVDASSGLITTVAGNGTYGYSGDGGAATSAQLYYPTGVAVDGSGNLYISDNGNYRLRKVTAATGVITTFAGNGGTTYGGDSGSALNAQFYYPNGMTVDGSGNLYIVDTNNQRIRKVDASSGLITTVAGNGTYGYSGDGGAATSAQLYYPNGVAVDGSGNLYIADTSNNCVRKVTAATGVITTVAGDGTNGFAGDGAAATSAQLRGPRSVLLDPSGNLYIADFGNYRIRRVDAATGFITTIAGTGTMGTLGDGGPAAAAQLWNVYALARDSAGNLYLADNFRVRKIDALTGTITSVAGGTSSGFSGDSGPATSATFTVLRALAVDVGGSLYLADSTNHRIRKVDAATGIVTTLAGTGTAGYGGDTGVATGAMFNTPAGLVLDSAGRLYIEDTNNNVIRRIP